MCFFDVWSILKRISSGSVLWRCEWWAGGENEARAGDKSRLRKPQRYAGRSGAEVWRESSSKHIEVFISTLLYLTIQTDQIAGEYMISSDCG